MQPEVLALVSWHLLAHYSFYATAHQPTLSQINWHAAFVGRTALYDHNNVVSAILILLNTFGGHVLVYLLYPLLVIAPNAIYTIYPSLAPRRTAKMVIKNQNGTKQREIVKIINDAPNGAGGGAEGGIAGAGAAAAGGGVGVGGDGIGARPVNVTTFAGLDSENEHLDIAHGELSLYENEDLFFGQLYKTGVQFIILQSIRVSATRKFKANSSLIQFLFPLGFWFDDRMHNTLSPSDGVEDIRTAIYIRSNRNVFHIWSDTHWIFSGSADTCSG